MIKALKSNIKDKRKCFDLMMASVIFTVAVIELFSWYLSFGEPATITDKGNNYLLWWYPVLSSATIWVFSLFFILKILRYNACVYTSLITIIYFAIQTFNLAALYFQFGYVTYNLYIYPVFLFTIVGLSIIKFTRWLSKSL